MKIKLVIDFLSKEAEEIINYLYEYQKNQVIDLEIYGRSINNDEINQAYYGLYYANKYGVGLAYTHEIVKAYHRDHQDIGDLKVVAQTYELIGYDKNDMIDALMEGDYVEMHEYFQHLFEEDNITKDCFAYLYSDQNDKKIVIGFEEIKAVLQ
ncbi:hypothetical protein LJB88_03070 [Erysipelotrichaceae bacterium OttesenSCG-928-M19]|nr:hypothetical protein [Erysipelotrichaceae bacterium OttesenSCG-928-M19]